MMTTIGAIFENGLLRPLSPLSLPEHARVRLVVDDLPHDLRDDARADWLKQFERTLTAIWDNAQDHVFNPL